MRMICLDVEGVLLPEIWHEIANLTGIKMLSRTTREEPDYSVLMVTRLTALNSEGISFETLTSCAAGIDPLPGAVDFLKRMRQRYQVALISDSFYEFLQPVSPKLGFPAIYCHRLLRAPNGLVEGWRPRLSNQKPKCVRAFQNLGFEVFAAGDSFNDLGMLDTADHAALIHAPDHIRQQRPDLAACENYAELEDQINKAYWKTPAIH